MEKMLYGVKDRPSTGKLILFALQQLLAIIAGTITLPLIVGNGMSQSTALFGASIPFSFALYICFTSSTLLIYSEIHFSIIK